MSFNLATILHESALAAPDSTGLRFNGNTVSHGELDDVSGRSAAGPLASGREPGDVVAIHLPNLPQFLVAHFGVLKAGLVALPLAPC